MDTNVIKKKQLSRGTVLPDLKTFYFNTVGNSILKLIKIQLNQLILTSTSKIFTRTFAVGIPD